MRAGSQVIAFAEKDSAGAKETLGEKAIIDGHDIK